MRTLHDTRLATGLSLPLAAVLVAAFALAPSSARADIDLEGVLLLGTGVDTGDAHNNPYAFQFGGALELTVSGFVMGFRATRSVASSQTCKPSDITCARVNDLRAIGGDLGFDWELGILHLGPRVGLGYLNEKDGGSRVAGYMEPGGVAEVEVGWFVGGVDLRYRVAFNQKALGGFLAYGRLGLRF